MTISTAKIYLAEAGERPNAIMVDLRDGRIWSDARDVDEYRKGTGIPVEEYYGLVRKISIPELNYRQANRLLRALAGYGQPIAEGSDEVRRGDQLNPAIELDADASAAWQAIGGICQRLADAAEDGRRDAEVHASSWGYTPLQHDRAGDRGARAGIDGFLLGLAVAA